MSRMRFHPQRHGARSILNRGLSEFFFQNRKSNREKEKYAHLRNEKEEVVSEEGSVGDVVAVIAGLVVLLVGAAFIVWILASGGIIFLIPMLVILLIFK